MTDETDKPFKRNPVFWLMFLLPGAAVAASFVTLAIAVAGADRALPSNYHWEGDRLDEDFERARRAASLGIRGTLRWEAGQCVLRLDGGGGDTLRLMLTHAIDAGLDRVVLLKRTQSDEYHAPCAELPAGGWRLSLEDDAAGWSLRQRVDALTHVDLAARHPEGSAG